MKKKVYLLPLTIIISLFLANQIFGHQQGKNDIIFEGDSFSGGIPQLNSVSNELIFWVSGLDAILYDIEQETQSTLPPPCASASPQYGRVIGEWISLRVDCFQSDTGNSLKNGYIYNLKSNTYTLLNDLGDSSRLPTVASPITDGKSAIWLQRDSTPENPNYTQSELYVLDLQTGIVSQPAFSGELVIVANVSTPWIVAQTIESENPSGNVKLSIYNLDTQDEYLINQSTSLDRFLVAENHVVWTTLSGNDIYYHNLLTEETNLAVENKYDHQLGQAISRSILYFTVDPNIERDASESKLEPQRAFNHTQIHSHNLVSGETKIIYENDDAQAIGPVFSYGDNLVWREDTEISPANSLHRVYLRNITPFKSFFPFVDQ